MSLEQTDGQVRRGDGTRSGKSDDTSTNNGNIDGLHARYIIRKL
jgi:hypothetical protein